MIISKAMNAQLNEQITSEFGAAQNYLAMVCVFETMGYRILAKRFLAQEAEEREHAMKIIKYVQDTGGTVRLDAIAAPKSDFQDVAEMIRCALDSEKDISERIYKLVALADSEKDYATRSFLNWFVDEQVEEVSSMTDLLNLIELAKGNILQVESRIRHEMAATK